LIAVAVACNLPDLALTALNRVAADESVAQRIADIRAAILADYQKTSG
jgi:hypothetical protein